MYTWTDCYPDQVPGFNFVPEVFVHFSGKGVVDGRLLLEDLREDAGLQPSLKPVLMPLLRKTVNL